MVFQVNFMSAPESRDTAVSDLMKTYYLMPSITARGIAMKNDMNTQIKICPRCGNSYHGSPALSRADNETLICPDCGTREALESIGVKPSEQEEILETIHRSMKK